MRRILTLLVFAVFTATACSNADVAPSTTTSTTTTTTTPCATVRIVALGDSYTAGTGIETGSWPQQLEEALEEGCDDFTIEAVAGDGWNTKRLSRELDRTAIAGKADAVILAIGVNDVVLGFGEENFREGLDLLAGHIEALSNDSTRLLMLSIPDFRVSPWGQERLERDYPVERYNEILGEFAARIDATFIDITTTSAAGLEDPDLIAPDDLHFSAKMYALWVEQMAEALRAVPGS